MFAGTTRDVTRMKRTAEVERRNVRKDHYGFSETVLEERPASDGLRREGFSSGSHHSIALVFLSGFFGLHFFMPSVC